VVADRRSSVSIWAKTHWIVSISVHRLSKYPLLRDGCISLFFCIILLCIISCSDLNASRVDDCADGEDGDDSFEFNSMLLFIKQNKSTKERVREIHSKDAAKLIYDNPFTAA
jgi:hypothetical protein